MKSQRISVKCVWSRLLLFPMQYEINAQTFDFMKFDMKNRPTRALTAIHDPFIDPKGFCLMDALFSGLDVVRILHLTICATKPRNISYLTERITWASLKLLNWKRCLNTARQKKKALVIVGATLNFIARNWCISFGWNFLAINAYKLSNW